MRTRSGARVVVMLMVLAIAIATLTPSDQLNPWPWYCLWCDEQALADAIVNVVMFVPLGMSLCAAGVPARYGILASAALASAVETLQGTVIPGRDPSLRDALTNTLGAAIGILIVARWRQLLYPSPKAAAWLAAGAATAWLGVLAISGLGVRPCAPNPPYDAEWSPLLPNQSPFRGRVVGATLYGDSLRDGPLPSVIRDRFQTGRVTLTTRVVPDEDRFNSATMLAVVGFQRIALSIAHSRRTVVAALPQCSWQLRLRPTLFALSRALEVAFMGKGTGTALIAVAATPERLNITVTGDGGASSSTSLHITPFLGWSLVRPFDARVRDGTRWITALWIVGLVLPFGYWWGRAAALTGDADVTPSRVALAGVIALTVLAAGMTGVARVLSLSPADVPEWIEALLGVGAGAWLARALARREQSARDGARQARGGVRA